MVLKGKFLSSHAEFSDLMAHAPALPLVAIIGRSNVGKSSLINHLCHQKGLAKVSKKPGKTKLLNLFETPFFTLVDLPGYGYAKVAPEEREKWGEMIEEFLSQAPLKKILFLLDARRMPSMEDKTMQIWIRQNKIPCIHVLTKIDLISPVDLDKREKEILLDLDASASFDVVHYSIFVKEGRDLLIKKLRTL